MPPSSLPPHAKEKAAVKGKPLNGSSIEVPVGGFCTKDVVESFRSEISTMKEG